LLKHSLMIDLSSFSSVHWGALIPPFEDTYEPNELLLCLKCFFLGSSFVPQAPILTLLIIRRSNNDCINRERLGKNTKRYNVESRFNFLATAERI